MDADPNLIRSLECQWRDALMAKDFDRLKDLVHPSFKLIGTRSTGPFMLTRDEWLDAIQRREVVSITFDIHDCTSFGDAMVGTVESRWKVKYLGGEIEDCVLLTDVWVNEDGRWQVVRRHSTPSPPPAAARKK